LVVGAGGGGGEHTSICRPHKHTNTLCL